MVTITQIKNQPEIIKFQSIDNLHKFKVLNNNNNGEITNNIHNNNSLNSMSFKTQTTINGGKTRILVKKENPIKFSKFSIYQDSHLSNDINANIKQNIIGSMRSYGNFINNPLTSNQSLVNPNYNENLLGMKSRTIYLLSTNEQNLSSENFSLRKSNVDEFKQRSKRYIKKKGASENNNDSDTEKQVYVPTSKILTNNETIKSTLVPIRQTDGSIKTNNQTESSDIFQKKVCFSDTDSKDAVRDASSNASNTNGVSNLSKNIFLNYKPTQIRQQSSTSLLNEKSKNENQNESKISNNNNNLNLSTNSKKLNRRNSIMNNSHSNNNNQSFDKKPPVLVKSKTSIELISSNPKKVTKISPEQYLDKYTILRIENWIQDVNNQTKIAGN